MSSKLRTFEYEGMRMTAVTVDGLLTELVFKNEARDCGFVVPLDILAYEFVAEIETYMETLP